MKTRIYAAPAVKGLRKKYSVLHLKSIFNSDSSGTDHCSPDCVIIICFKPDGADATCACAVIVVILMVKPFKALVPVHHFRVVVKYRAE